MPGAETRLRVRYAEVDQMGVVHHSRCFALACVDRAGTLTPMPDALMERLRLA